MNESILIKKIIQVGVNLESGHIEYSGAEADAKAIIEEIKLQCSIKDLPIGEVAISSKALTNPNWKE